MSLLTDLSCAHFISALKMCPIIDYIVTESEQIRILMERQKEHILADCGAEIQKHEFHADFEREVSQN